MDKEVSRAIMNIVVLGFKILGFVLSIMIGFIGGIFGAKV